ncbi:MAG: ABC transporter permease [Actinomycetia bacterium]|nr:ABC transporter permease [Actinomycetes bacterium]
MATTFIYTIKTLIREKTNLIWAVAFPLVLSTLFFSMFHNIDETYRLDPLPVLVVADDNYQQAKSFSTLVGALAAPDANDGQALLAPTFTSSAAEASESLQNGAYLGYITVDEQQQPHYFMDSRKTGGLDILPDTKQGIVLSILDRYSQDYQMIYKAASEHPQLFADPGFMDRLLDGQSFTTQVSATNNPPSSALRYYYAVLAFSCFQMMSFGIYAIRNLRTNASPMGARRCLGGQSLGRSMIPTLLASWVLSLACLLIGFLYIRFGFGVSFGGQEGACVAVIALGSLVATLLGALIGALPTSEGAKAGLMATLVCLLSVFSGLYGPGSQQLGDMVAKNLPALSLVNPIRQVADAFYSLYYYDSLGHFWLSLAILGIMAAVCAIGCLLCLRKQRYRSL